VYLLGTENVTPTFREESLMKVPDNCYNIVWVCFVVFWQKIIPEASGFGSQFLPFPQLTISAEYDYRMLTAYDWKFIS